MSEKEIRQQIAYHMREINRLNKILYPKTEDLVLCVDCGEPVKAQQEAKLRIKLSEAVARGEPNVAAGWGGYKPRCMTCLRMTQKGSKVYKASNANHDTKKDKV